MCGQAAEELHRSAVGHIIIMNDWTVVVLACRSVADHCLPRGEAEISKFMTGSVKEARAPVR